ncbi:hypothetical protein [Amycolatopsis anabasis]|uniref:hypothetical protein n=1 Tax=Amycolatopsis anabasis TaxID=1840409 RepID=UPI00131BAAB0|nr:hypothetical protein [Amycolatopsis anabasis]
MLEFSRVLLAHQLLNPELTNTVLTGKVQPPGNPRPPSNGKRPMEPPKYGYGFADKRINGVRIVGHNGGTPGYEGEIDIYPETGHLVVILTNQDQVESPAMRRSEELLTS